MFSHRLDWDASANALAEAEADTRSRGSALLDLTVTNPTVVGLDYPEADLATALAAAFTARYEPAALGTPRARAAVAAHVRGQSRLVDPAAVAITASSSESYSLLFKLLCNPGDCVLVPTPSYPLFDFLTALEGVRARPYRLEFDGRWHIDFSSIDFTDARALVVVNPNNPTGSLVTRAEHARLASLCADRDVSIISDEVFADYVHDPDVDAISSLLGTTTPALTFCLGGLSKGSGLPQLKIGWIVAHGPPRLVEGALQRLELIADTYLSVSGPVQSALPRLLDLGAHIRSLIAVRVATNRHAMHLAFPAAAPVSVLPSQAGWSVIVRVPAVMDDEAWALNLVKKHGLLVQPGYFFDLTLGATLVMSLLPEPADFAEGLHRLSAAVDAAL